MVGEGARCTNAQILAMSVAEHGENVSKRAANWLCLHMLVIHV